MHRLLAALLVCGLSLFAISAVLGESDFLLDDAHVSEVDRNLTDLLNRHESGEITQEQFELEAANLILNSGEDPTLRHAAESDEAGASSWHDKFATGQQEHGATDLSYVWDDCFIDEAGLVNINGTEECDLVVAGVDVHADALPGGIDGHYKLVSCFNGKPMYRRLNSPEAEERTLWFSVIYGDWEFSYGTEPSEDQLLMYGDFGFLSPLDVPDWHLAAALNSVEVANMPSEEEDLYFIVPRVDVACSDGSQAARVKEHYDNSQFTTLGAHIAYDEHIAQVEEATGEPVEEFAANKLAESERSLEEDGDPVPEGEGTGAGGGDEEEGVWQNEDSCMAGLPDEKDIGIFADFVDHVSEEDGECGGGYVDELSDSLDAEHEEEKDDLVPVLPGDAEEDEEDEAEEGAGRAGGYGIDEAVDDDGEGEEKDEL